MAISLTESAAQHVRQNLTKRGAGAGLRLSVKASGCSGFAYVLDYADDIGSDDQVFESHGVKVVVPKDSLSYIDGTELDYVKKGMMGSSFVFRNPKVAGECGCGESFTVKNEDGDAA